MKLNPIRFLFLCTALVSPYAHAAAPENPSNGQLYQEQCDWLAWREAGSRWLSPEDFWLEYARSSGGKFWGRSGDYPPYDQVSEHDTLLIENEQGSCLMYFFHSRWRRAQDVRRWDPVFNELAGCPHVFD